jgi:hypothetical protein
VVGYGSRRSDVGRRGLKNSVAGELSRYIYIDAWKLNLFADIKNKYSSRVCDEAQKKADSSVRICPVRVIRPNIALL